MTLDRVR